MLSTLSSGVCLDNSDECKYEPKQDINKKANPTGYDACQSSFLDYLSSCAFGGLVNIP